jgi:hypothetical protein
MSSDVAAFSLATLVVSIRNGGTPIHDYNAGKITQMEV